MDTPGLGEPSALQEMEHFARTFQKKRIELGFSQADIGLAMGKLDGNDFSQTTISRFEALSLSFKNMCKLKPLLEKWLKNAENHKLDEATTSPSDLGSSDMGLNHTPNRRRKKRTTIQTNIKVALEKCFRDQNPKPTPEELSVIAHQLNMDKEVIRVWFCNRRQKEKKINPRSSGRVSSTSMKAILPSTVFMLPSMASFVTSNTPNTLTGIPVLPLTSLGFTVPGTTIGGMTTNTVSVIATTPMATCTTLLLPAGAALGRGHEMAMLSQAPYSLVDGQLMMMASELDAALQSIQLPERPSMAAAPAGLCPGLEASSQFTPGEALLSLGPGGLGSDLSTRTLPPIESVWGLESSVTLPISSLDGGETLPITSLDGGVTLPISSLDGGVTLPITSLDGGVTLPITSLDGGVTLPITSLDGGVTLPITSLDGSVTLPISSLDGGETLPITSLDGGVTLPITSLDGGVTLPISSLDGRVTLPISSLDGGMTLPITSLDGRVTLPISSLDGHGNLLFASTSVDSISNPATAPLFFHPQDLALLTSNPGSLVSAGGMGGVLDLEVTTSRGEAYYSVITSAASTAQ